VYGATPARLRSTAIEQISSILAEEEPREVGYMLANLDETSRIAGLGSTASDLVAPHNARDGL
jgi:hypothetical protein